MNNSNSVQIPLNIGDEGGDQPPPYSPRAMETNEQPNAPAPNAVELEPISGDESPSPSPPPPPPPSLQSRNPTPPPPGEEEIMVYNIPLT